MTQLEQKIHGYIKSLYNATFNGLLRVDKLESGYTLVIGIPIDTIPMYISYGIDDEAEFLKFVCKEIASRNLIRRHFYKIEKINEEGRNNNTNR